MFAVLTMVPLLLGLRECPSLPADGPAAGDPYLACFLDKTPRCGDERRHCAGLHLHLADGAELTPAWVAASLVHAFKLFAPTDVGFQVVAIDRIGSEFAVVETREQRDAIGRKLYERGVIHVFLVARLDDVDVPGTQIRGVHWRQRSNTDKRWVILSQLGSHVVMAHELGHFFGLPHSSYRDSIMNKRPRTRPSWEDRVFVPEELEIVRRERDAMFSDGTLVER